MNAAPFRAAGRALLSARSKVGTQPRHASGYTDPHFKPAHMDEMPVPQGSWKANYDARQKNYNLQLAAGIIIFTSTLSYIVGSDKIFFNFFPPPLPEEGK